MKKIILFIIFPLTFIGQQLSTIQEQSLHYKNFSFTNDTQWDSLNTIENGSVYRLNGNQFRSTTTPCALTKKVYGWHPYWMGSVYNNYDWSMLSDFCYFDYTVSPTTGNNTNASFDWATSAAVTAALTNSVNVHFCATLFSSHSTFWGSSTAQQTFITNAINLLNTRGGNGINIDFEGMVASDKVPFTNFMTNLCSQVHAANTNYIVTLSLYAVDWSGTFDIPNLNLIVDNYIIMGYDYYYSGSVQAGPVSPLYNFQTSYNQTLSKSITYYLKQGASKSKLLLGLPWYGREWETIASTAPSNTTGGFTSARTYNYVKNAPTTYSLSNKHWDNNSFNPYFSYQNAGIWRQCWIDDNYSYGRKFDMVNQRGIGGIGIWALGYDDGYQDLWQLIKGKFSNCAIVASSDSIYDMGGPGRNYYDSESYTYSIAPTGAGKVQLNFSQMDLEQDIDFLYLYDGATTASPLLTTITGSVIPPAIISSGPEITVKFTSDNATIKSGYKAIYTSILENIAPTTTATSVGLWKTTNFTETFADADNVGGSGLDKSFYQVSDFNGTDWRANGNRGYFYDDFNTPSLSNDWTTSIGTWTVIANSLEQSDESNANTNIYAAVTQSLSNRYLYSFKGTINGSGSNRRGGIHIMCDDPTQTDRGNNYLIWIRPDNSQIQLYKTTTNTLTLVSSIAYSINIGTAYDYKISCDRISGEIKLWVNNTFVTSWIDTAPFGSGTAVSFRSGNSKFTIDDFAVYHSRPTSVNVSVGAANTNDVRYQNTNPVQNSAKVKSIVTDLAGNISSVSIDNVNVDWSAPSNIAIVNDGKNSDINSVITSDSLSANWSSSKDINSAISKYWYSIGTTPGAINTLTWTSNNTDTLVTAKSLSLTVGQVYYFNVKAEDGAGLMSNLISTNGQTVSPSCTAPTLTITGGGNFCPAQTKTLTASGAISYTWMPGGATTNSIVVTPTITTVYTITATNGGTCSITNTVQLTSNANPTISVNASPATICLGGFSKLTAAGASTYTWSTGANSNTINVTPTVTATYSVIGKSVAGCTNTKTISVTVNTGPTLTVTAIPNNFCLGNTSTLTVSGATTYIWDTGAQTNTINVTPIINTVYTVTGTATGCSSTKTISVNPIDIVLSSTITNIACNVSVNSGSISLLPGGGTFPYYYSWSNGASTANIKNLAVGTYSVLVSDANGCVDSLQLNVTQPTSLTVNTVIVSPACGLNDGQISSSVSGGTSPYTYIWNSGATTPVASSLTPGQYIVQVYDASNCYGSAIVNLNPTNGPVVTVGTTNSVSCYGGNNGSTSINASGGTAPLSIQWSNGSTANSINGLTAGVYDVLVTDGSGCKINESITINQPYGLNVQPIVTRPNCTQSNGAINLNIIGGQAPFTFTWSVNAGSATTQNVSGIASGYYNVAIGYNSGCAQNFGIGVSDLTNIAVNVVTVTPSSCTSPSGSIDITAVNGIPTYSFSWSNGAATEDLNSISPGNYFVTVTDADLCKISTSVFVPSNIYDYQPEICLVSVDTSNNTNYLVWQKNITYGVEKYKIYRESSVPNNFQFVADVPFSALSEYTDLVANADVHSWRYRLSSVDSCGNEIPSYIDHKTIYLNVNFGATTNDLTWNYYAGFSYPKFFISRYDITNGWQLYDSVPGNIHSYTDITPPVSGEVKYLVEANAPFGCIAQLKMAAQTSNKTKSNVKNNNFEILPTKTKELIDNYLFISPNPAKDELNIHFNNPIISFTEIKIMDVLGKELLSDHMSTGTNFIIPLHNFASGLYFIHTQNGKNTIVKKFVKE